MICVYEVLVYCIVSPQSIYFSCSYYASGMILSQCLLFATNELLGVGHIYVVVHHVFYILTHSFFYTLALTKFVPQYLQKKKKNRSHSTTGYFFLN